MNSDLILKRLDELEFIMTAVMEALEKDDMDNANIGISMASDQISALRSIITTSKE